MYTIIDLKRNRIIFIVIYSRHEVTLSSAIRFGASTTLGRTQIGSWGKVFGMVRYKFNINVRLRNVMISISR